MGGSGGASGDVVLPEYLIFQQANWLNNVEPLRDAGAYATAGDWSAEYATANTFNVRDEMVLSADANPFTGVAAFDPTSYLDENDTRAEDFIDAADDIDPEDILTDAIAAAIEEIDGQLTSEAVIQASVTAYEQSTNSRFLRESGRAMMSLQGGRAVMTTHYDARTVDMEMERGYDVGRYEAELRLRMNDQRIQLAQYLSGQFVQLIQLRLNALQNAATLQIDISKVRVAAEQDRINLDLNLDVNEANWRLDRFDYGAKMIAAYSGGGPAPKPLSTGERVLQAVGVATQAGIAGGNALGSPGAGIGIGVTTLLASLLSGGLR
jgi:hypothetical protein